jgi:hypothetical protein
MIMVWRWARGGWAGLTGLALLGFFSAGLANMSRRYGDTMPWEEGRPPPPPLPLHPGCAGFKGDAVPFFCLPASASSPVGDDDATGSPATVREPTQLSLEPPEHDRKHAKKHRSGRKKKKLTQPKSKRRSGVLQAGLAEREAAAVEAVPSEVGQSAADAAGLHLTLAQAAAVLGGVAPPRGQDNGEDHRGGRLSSTVERAIAGLRSMIDRDPTDAAGLSILAALHRRLGQEEEAARLLLHARGQQLTGRQVLAAGAEARSGVAQSYAGVLQRLAQRWAPPSTAHSAAGEAAVRRDRPLAVYAEPFHALTQVRQAFPSVAVHFD